MSQNDVTQGQPSLPHEQHYLAIAGLMLSAVNWGIIWYPYRILQAAGFTGITASFCTYGITLLLSLLLCFNHWKSLKNIPKSTFWLCLLAGWTNLSYVLAVMDGEVMRVMLLFYLSPLWTVLMARFWLNEVIHKQHLVVVGVSMAGAIIMLWEPTGLPIPSSASDWLALSSGVGFAATNVFTKQSTQLSVFAKSVAIWVGVFFTAGVMIIMMQHQPFPYASMLQMENLGWMLLIAAMIMSATLAVQYGIPKIALTKASVIFLFELVAAAIASYVLAGESMALHEWIGGLLIVFAAYWSARSESH